MRNHITLVSLTATLALAPGGGIMPAAAGAAGSPAEVRADARSRASDHVRNRYAFGLRRSAWELHCGLQTADGSWRCAVDAGVCFGAVRVAPATRPRPGHRWRATVRPYRIDCRLH